MPRSPSTAMSEQSGRKAFEVAGTSEEARINWIMFTLFTPCFFARRLIAELLTVENATHVHKNAHCHNT